ncbi:hypothetical protein Moror_3862 [Moniliophthora roreri MCA 2997]|uniref:Uncharacterized protein n=2 Tax=Moniliophthora roreri TaxID=221103 RepID=V2YUR6_MONRO|nr:hypothetical protein Moror_3862 [Moniliophthora roreri MCA 2997]
MGPSTLPETDTRLSERQILELVSLNFRRNGATPLDEYFSSFKTDREDVNYAFDDLNSDSQACRRAIEKLQGVSQDGQLVEIGVESDHRAEVRPSDAVDQLTMQCRRYLPHCNVEDVLKWESTSTKDAESGRVAKTCTFTITKPDGSSMSVKTTKKRGVRADTARIAIEQGALDFIASGASEDTSTSASKPDDPIAKIEEAHRISPNSRLAWYRHAERLQKGGKYGYALLVQFCKGSFRVYSTSALWDDEKQARAECASVALQDGIIDYIHSGLDGDPEDPSPSWSNLQHFYESLPQPFPESFGGATAEQIHAVKWLDGAVKQANDVKHAFFIIHNKKEQLFGFVLRLEHAGETKTYMVEPRFKKEKEAKVAVCLQAMSQGVGDYLRALRSSASDVVTNLVRALVRQKILPALEQLCKQNSISTEIKFSNDKGAFGATLKVKLVGNSAQRPKRKYTVPKEYRTKDDAEDAVYCTAARDGLFEFVSPPDHPSQLGNATTLAKEAERALAHEPYEAEPGELIGQSKHRKVPKIPEFGPPFSLSDYKPSWNLPVATVAHLNPHVDPVVPVGRKRSDHSGEDHDERKRKKMKTKDG